MRLEQHLAVVLDRRPDPEAGNATERRVGQAMHPHHEDAHGGRPRMCKAQVERRESECAAELAAVHDVAADAVGAAEQGLRAGHVAGGEGLSHLRTRDAHAVDLVAHHPRHVEAGTLARAVEHRVVAATPGTEAEVVADQHIARAEAAHQHLVDEVLRCQRGQCGIEAQHHGLIDPAALELAELVAQAGDSGRRQLGLARQPGKPVARMRLERHHRARQPAVLGFAAQQRQHRLVAAMHAVEVADRQRAGGGDAGMVETAEDAHRSIIAMAQALCPCLARLPLACVCADAPGFRPGGRVTFFCRGQKKVTKEEAPNTHLGVTLRRQVVRTGLWRENVCRVPHPPITLIGALHVVRLQACVKTRRDSAPAGG